MNKKATEQFIKEAKLVHGNKYDYSLTEYIAYNKTVKIICPVHGIFEQTPLKHLSGHNCQKCSLMNKKKTTEQFIKEARLIHGNKYDYSLVEYVDASTKVKIICPEHGEFLKSPSKHTSGKQGCPKCGYSEGTSLKKKTTEQFIKEARLIHGNKYDYSLTEYIAYNKTVKIICSKHGIFEQVPIKHINGHGCPKCAGKNKTTEDFIKEAKLVHENKYDYSLVKYMGAYKKVKIICPVHGIFEQIARIHLLGKGCKKCSSSKGELEIIKFLNKQNIKFEHNKTFDGLIDKRKLSYDFYLPDYNLLIEYNGKQHYKPIKYFGGVRTFLIQLKHDFLKKIYAKKIKVNLIVIKYNDDVENKLKYIKENYEK